MTKLNEKNNIKYVIVPFPNTLLGLLTYRIFDTSYEIYNYLISKIPIPHDDAMSIKKTLEHAEPGDEIASVLFLIYVVELKDGIITFPEGQKVKL